MNYPNVMDMPISHTKEDITLEEVKDILNYNLNDVLATFEFYKKSSGKIALRNSLKKEFGLYCMNWSDSKIGEKLILKLYSDKIGAKPYPISKLRTNRLKIELKDVILDYIAFSSPEFNKLLELFKNTTIYGTKDAFKESVIYKGFKYDYGTGGIHGCIKSGIYESDDDYIIIDADVTSLYPNISITNNFYPEHLGEEFVSVYKQIVNLRTKAKKEGNLTLSDGYKLSANSVFGKSNDANSFLYDPKFTMAITLNGQLLLTMLAETLVDNIKDMTVLQINTDGITVKLPNNQRSINAYNNICKEWEDKTKLQLEYVEYSKMIIGDVNNYIAVKTDGKCKYKGGFEIDKVVGNEPAYHKDNSFKIIPIALSNYFVHNIPIEETIRNHNNIYDFCGRQKFKGQDCGKTHYIQDNTEIIELQQKNVRYYISNKGSVFIKYYGKGTTELINKGYLVTIFNNYKESDNYDINYSFYISECYKEIQQIENKQLTLF